MLVIAVLLILAAVTFPSIAAMQGNVRQKAATDTVRARIADGRARAMEHGAEYRLAVHQDGTRLRLAADGPDFADRPADNPPTGSSLASEDTLEKATVAVLADASMGETPADSSGWVTIATFLPDGTCREDSVVIAINEPTFPAMRVHLRGVTGSSRVLPPDTTVRGKL